MKTMDHVRSRMRQDSLPAMRSCVAHPQVQKSADNLTKAIDLEAEDMIVDAVRCKFGKLPGVKSFAVFSEELGIQTFPEGAREPDHHAARPGRDIGRLSP